MNKNLLAARTPACLASIVAGIILVSGCLAGAFYEWPYKKEAAELKRTQASSPEQP